MTLYEFKKTITCRASALDCLEFLQEAFEHLPETKT